MSKKNSGSQVDSAQILVVDDHPIVRQGFAQLINQEPDLTVCGEAEDASGALEAVASFEPAVVTVDLSLKGSNGLELIKSIRSQHPKTRVLVVSMHEESLYAERVLRAGAQGYIMKDEASEKIVTGIRQVMSGEVYVSEYVAKRMLHKLRGGGSETGESSLDCLTDRELEVCRLIGGGLSTRQTAQELHLSIKTVETYREHLKKKLGIKNASELIKHAVQWVQSEKTFTQP